MLYCSTDEVTATVYAIHKDDTDLYTVLFCAQEDDLVKITVQHVSTELIPQYLIHQLYYTALIKYRIR